MAASVRDAEVDEVNLQPTIETLQIQDYTVALDGSGAPVPPHECEQRCQQ